MQRDVAQPAVGPHKLQAAVRRPLAVRSRWLRGGQPFLLTL